MRRSLMILPLAILLTLSGCVTLYKPNVVHSPLLKEKGELNTSASIGISGNGLLNLQAAYAASDHVGIMVDGMYHLKNTTTGSDTGSGTEKLRILSGEAGAGYFKILGSEKNKLFQCYSGGGYGVTSDKIYEMYQSNPEVSGKYFNIFIQPGVALISEKFELAFDLKANYVHLFDANAYLYDKFEWWNTDFHFYSDTTLNFVNLEPAITMKAGRKRLRSVLQMGLIIPTINTDSYYAVSNSSLLVLPLFKVSAGVAYTFGKKSLMGK